MLFRGKYSFPPSPPFMYTSKVEFSFPSERIGWRTGPIRKVTLTLTCSPAVVLNTRPTVLARDSCLISVPWASLSRGAFVNLSAGIQEANDAGQMCSSEPVSTNARASPWAVTLLTPVVVVRSSVSGDVSTSALDNAITTPAPPALAVPPVSGVALAAWTRDPLPSLYLWKHLSAVRFFFPQIWQASLLPLWSPFLGGSLLSPRPLPLLPLPLPFPPSWYQHFPAWAFPQVLQWGLSFLAPLPFPFRLWIWSTSMGTTPPWPYTVSGFSGSYLRSATSYSVTAFLMAV